MRKEIGKTQMPSTLWWGRDRATPAMSSKDTLGEKIFFRMYCDGNCEFPFATNWVPILPSSI